MYTKLALSRPLSRLLCALTLCALSSCTSLITVDREDNLNGTSMAGGEEDEGGGEVYFDYRDAALSGEGGGRAGAQGGGEPLAGSQGGGEPLAGSQVTAPPPDMSPPPENTSCSACVARDAVVRGLSRLPIPLYCGHIEASDDYVPIIWTSAEGATGAERPSASGRAVPGWMGHYTPDGEPARGGRVAAWGHEGLLTTAPDPIPEAGLARERLIAWLAGSGSRRVGVMEGHSEWLHMGTISSQLVSNLSRAGVELEALPAPITPESLTDLDAVIFGNPWEPITTRELDALMSWLPGDRGLLLLGLGWSWAPSHPDDPNGEGYAVNALAARLNLSFYEGVINDPNTLAPPPEQPTYRVRPLSEWPGALPSE
jgi:hypothetical protein